jgi:tetratricopeptide (TPR) repeat protein
MPRRRAQIPDENERREDALRPSPYLGYDRDRLAMYLVGRGVYEIAESQFRRAIWLNPFQPRFKAHLAWCLYKQGRHCDALACLAEVPEAQMHADMRTIARLIEQGVAKASWDGR